MRAIEKYLGNKTNIIWDWNGTLVNDVDLCVSLLAKEMKGHHLEPISKEHHQNQFSFPIVDYYRKIGFKFSDDEFKEMSIKFSAKLSEGIFRCELFEGAKSLLVELKSKGIRHAVLSATPEEFLIKQVKHFNIYEIFELIYGLPDRYAASKVNRGRQLMEVANFKPDQTILVGDTEHDLDVGQALGVEVLLLAQGHQSYDRLKNRHHQVLNSGYGIDFKTSSNFATNL